MIGYDASKAQIDSTAGSVALNLRDTFTRVKSLNTWLAGKTSADLEALGYTTGEVAQLKSAIGDLDQLRTIYEGTAALAVAKNFTTFAKLLIGIN